jgi:hypothetical protein
MSVSPNEVLAPLQSRPQRKSNIVYRHSPIIKLLESDVIPTIVQHYEACSLSVHFIFDSPNESPSIQQFRLPEMQLVLKMCTGDGCAGMHRLVIVIVL